MRELILFGVFFLLFGLPFVLFGLLTWMRKARYRALAGELGGRREGCGLLGPGAIVGKDFRVEASQVGKAYRTRVEVAVGETPDWFLLRRAFFRGSPDWSSARVPATREERVFLWQVTLPAQAEPDRAQQTALLAWLPRWPELAGLEGDLASAGVDEVLIEDGTVSVSFRGIQSDLARLRGTLEALRRLVPSRAAGRVAAHA